MIHKDTIIDYEEYIENTFEKMVLTQATVHKSVFDGCIFKGCDFTHTVFSSCKFVECTFINCNLSLIQVIHCEYNDTCFDGCKVIGVDWTKASWSSIVGFGALRFEHSNLNDSSFYGLKLHDIVLQECELQNVDFREGDFTQANFSKSNLNEALFANTMLEKANFIDATNMYIDITINHVAQAKFRRMDAVVLLEPLGLDLV